MLTVTGVASARRPPALVETQERVDRIFATCPQGRSTTGYRDMLSRFSSGSRLQAPQTAIPTWFTAPPQKMRDHIVLSCAGGTVHSGSGYRDMLWRFPVESAHPVLAKGRSPSYAKGEASLPTQ